MRKWKAFVKKLAIKVKQQNTTSAPTMRVDIVDSIQQRHKEP